MSLYEALRNQKGNSTVVELARDADGRTYKQSGVEQKVPEGLSRVDLDSRRMGKHDAIYKNYDYGEVMAKKNKKKNKKETSTHVQTRPPGPFFPNYDYGGPEEGSESGPGTGLYHGNMDKYKSVKDFLDKARKRPHTRKKAWEWLYLLVKGHEKTS